jgi:hypothetical protein
MCWVTAEPVAAACSLISLSMAMLPALSLEQAMVFSAVISPLMQHGHAPLIQKKAYKVSRVSHRVHHSGAKRAVPCC